MTIFNQKSVLRALILLVGMIAVFIGINFFVELNTYFKLSKKAPAVFENWKVEEVRSGKFAISVHYHFKVNGVTYREHVLISKPLYPNAYLAHDHLKKWKAVKKTVWYAPKDPHVSALFRGFPFKKGVHLVLVLGIFLYFVGLKFYLARH